MAGHQGVQHGTGHPGGPGGVRLRRAAGAAALCGQGNAWSRALWDVTAVAWLTGDFMLDRLKHSPIPTLDGHYAFDRRRHLIRYVYHIRRDALMEDLFTKLAGDLRR